MSGTYLYCQNSECGVYLGSLGGDSCAHCGWRSGCADESPASERPGAQAPSTAEPSTAAPEPESFWLIERGQNQGHSIINWWCDGPMAACGWQTDWSKATRFPTKIAAERIAQRRMMIEGDYAVVSHGLMADCGDNGFHCGDPECDACLPPLAAPSTGGAETAAVAQVVADEAAVPFRKVAWLGRDLPVGTMLYAASSAPAQAVETAGVREAPSLLINARQLRQALEFVNPDEHDADQQESEVVIQYLPARTSTDGEAMEAGLYVWLAEYPEEGCMPLLADEPAAQSPAASPASKEQP